MKCKNTILLLLQLNLNVDIATLPLAFIKMSMIPTK